MDILWQQILGNSLDKETSQALQALLPTCDLVDYAFTPLHLAVLGLGSASVEETLSSCSSLNIDTEDASGRTALWWAAYRGDFQSMELLIRHHADPHKADIYRFSPMSSAMKARSLRCVGLLLDCGIDVDQRNHYGDTLLMTIAEQSDDLELLSFLLKHGSNLNLQGQDGDTALLTALECQHNNVTKRLIQYGADIDIKENSGYNALSVAILFKVHPLIQLLLERQADHHGTIKQHGTLLHLIAEVADTTTLGILTNSTLATRDIQVIRSDGRTAVEVAKSRTDTTIEWQNAFYAFIWSVDKTKILVSPFGVSPYVNGDRVQTEESDGEGDVFVDAME